MSLMPGPSEQLNPWVFILLELGASAVALKSWKVQICRKDLLDSVSRSTWRIQSTLEMQELCREDLELLGMTTSIWMMDWSRILSWEPLSMVERQTGPGSKGRKSYWPREPGMTSRSEARSITFKIVSISPNYHLVIPWTMALPELAPSEPTQSTTEDKNAAPPSTPWKVYQNQRTTNG